MEKEIPVRLYIYPIGLDQVKLSEHDKLELAIHELRLYNPNNIYFYTIIKIER